MQGNQGTCFEDRGRMSASESSGRMALQACTREPSSATFEDTSSRSALGSYTLGTASTGMPLRGQMARHERSCSYHP